MLEKSIRDRTKAVLPVAVRQFLRGLLHYFQRLGRWLIILWQVRGVSWSDQWVLIRSAIAAPFLSFKHLLEWQDPILLGDAQVKVSGVGIFFVRAYCDDLWHVFPWREHAIFSVLRDKLSPGDTFIDAGANIGVYSVLAAKLVGPRGRVIAIEMMPDTANQLRNNLMLNKILNVEVVCAALDDVGGKHVSAGVVPGKYGQASIVVGSDDEAAVQVMVNTITLDKISESLVSVRLVKMDLEGAEAGAIRGGSRLLGITDGIIYERWRLGSVDLCPVDESLSKAGFFIRKIDGNNCFAEKVETYRVDEPVAGR